jgi:hypothetical protein
LRSATETGIYPIGLVFSQLLGMAPIENKHKRVE